ncbi:MAG: hypothetical protein IJM37_00610, partial [Lachnospiraceae bacterium]|nr:hypothetical protein [Lachnospiraceae bacterium]
MMRTKIIIIIACEIIIAIALGIIGFATNVAASYWDPNLPLSQQPLLTKWWFWGLLALFVIIPVVSAVLDQLKNKQDTFKSYINSIKPSVTINNPLHYRNDLLEYVGREKETEILKNFLNDERPLLWMGVVGDGGMGKSKFVRNFTQTAMKKCKGSWKAVWINGEIIDKILSYESWNHSKNLLLIYDYAGVSCEKVGEWIHKLEQTNEYKKKIRIILLEREGVRSVDDSIEPGWYSRFVGSGDVSYCVNKNMYKKNIGETGLLKLCGLEEAEAVRLIKSYIAAKDNTRTITENDAKRIYEKSREIDNKNSNPRPLYILLTADAWMENYSIDNLSTNKLVEFVLERHKTHWGQTVCNNNVALYNSILKLLTYTTACGEWELQDDFMVEELKAARNCLIDTNDAARIIKDINMQNEDGRSLMPLEPDLIGELFVLEQFVFYKNNNPDFLKELLKQCWEKPHSFAEFLIRCRQNYSAENKYKDMLSLDSHFFEIWYDDLINGIINEDSEKYAAYCEYILAFTHIETSETERVDDYIKKYYDKTQNEYIKLIYAKVLVNLSSKQEEAGAKESVEKLKKLSEKEGARQDEIRLCYAQGLFNLSSKQEETGTKESVEKLKELSEKEGARQDEIRLEYADGLVNLSSKQEEAGAKESVEKLKELSEKEGATQDEI